MINVTKTFIPPLEEYTQRLKTVWETAWLTNNGPLLRELESELKNYLDVPNIIVTTNGTLPLQIALRLLGEGGEIITTPFSYVATTSCIVWENCKPVFVDIHPEYLTIDETKIEAAITSKTRAILATHVFGNPCHVDEIQRIADNYGLKVIYDGAHCFGVNFKGQSIFNYGDVSTCSFHATKVFHTGEGGAMFARDEELNQKLFAGHNFGHVDPTTFSSAGINAKASELQAAMGLTMLPYMETIFAGRKKVIDHYNELLKDSGLQRMQIRPGTDWNYSYFPVIFESEEQCLEALEILVENSIQPRRYFYPSLNTLPYVKGARMPVSELISPRILCLPLFVGLAEADIERICRLIKSVVVPPSVQVSVRSNNPLAKFLS